MNHPTETILLVSLFLMNAAGFLVMFADKQKARRGHWRIPERTLCSSPPWAAVWEAYWACIFSIIRPDIRNLPWGSLSFWCCRFSWPGFASDDKKEHAAKKSTPDWSSLQHVSCMFYVFLPLQP